MRAAYEAELEELNKDIVSMSEQCIKAIQSAIDFLLTQDGDQQADITGQVQQISHQERDIENLCLRLLLKQQPIATDLRNVSAALKMVSDLERIGDNADDIAEIVAKKNVKPEAVKDSDLLPMARAAEDMLSRAVNSFVKQDESLARMVIDGDDVVDEYFDKVKLDLVKYFDSDNQENIDGVLDYFMIAKYFERIADHCVNIAQWVVFVRTGKLEGNTN